MLTDKPVRRRCPGCGAPFQSDEPDRAGFIPPEIDPAAPGVICRRCWRARHYRAWEPGAPGAEEARKGAAAAIRAADLVVWVVDVADFEGTAHPSLVAPWPAAAEKLWVAVNKTDLLPRHVPPAEVAAWVRQQLQGHGLDPRGVSLLSAATGAGIKSFWRDVADAVTQSRPWGRGGAVALLGATNTGKSRLIGRLADVGGAAPEAPPTVSAFPGMTAGPVRLRVPDGPELWDTPGLDTGGGRLSDRLCPDCASRLVPGAPLKGDLVELRPGQAYSWPSLAGIEVVDGPPDGPGLISAYGPEAAGGSRTRAERLLQAPSRSAVCRSCAARLREGPWTRVELHVEPRSDVAIAGLGWVTVRRGPLRLRLHVPEGVWYRVRPNLVGPKEARDWGASPRMGAGPGKGAGPARAARPPSRQRRAKRSR